MTSAAPIPMQWHGDAMIPLAGFQRRADEQFVIGQVYRLAEIEDRSEASHRQEFAWLRDAWRSLPESYGDQFPSSDHLRKAALIQTGFYHETILDVGSRAAALRVAAYAKNEDEFAHVVVRGGLVVVRKAKSQSRRAMDKAEFQASKTAILEHVAGMLGVEATTLQRQSEAA